MPSAKGAKPPLRLEWIEAGSLTDNPHNWRRHPDHQRAALKELLEDPEIGWAGACLFNERTGRLIDGHARRGVVKADEPIPVLVGSWSEEAEKKILATLDPISALAEADAPALEALLASVESDSPAVDDLLEQLARDTGLDQDPGEAKLMKHQVKPPPKMTWVLIGIPTVRFGEISTEVELIAAMDGVVVETTSNDG